MMNNTQDNARRQIGRVNEEECEQIRTLFERKNGLVELVRSLNAETMNDALYEKIITDLGQVTTRFNQWWEQTARRYGWESPVGYRWEIDFETGEIFLVKN